MRIATGLFLAALMAAPAYAQAAAPAPAASAAAPAFSADTPLGDVVANPAAKAALVKTLPDLPNHPAWDQFKAMSLRQLQPFAGGKITDELIAKVDTDLKAVPADARK